LEYHIIRHTKFIKGCGEVEADESYFGGKRRGKRGRGAMDKIPVFGILERNGKVKVEIVEDVSAETILRETLKKVKRGSKKL
jgi:transposase